LTNNSNLNKATTEAALLPCKPYGLNGWNSQTNISLKPLLSKS
jgi:hypothetical protein